MEITKKLHNLFKDNSSPLLHYWFIFHFLKAFQGQEKNYSQGNTDEEFAEWLRGFTDGEGYFSIVLMSRKKLNKFGQLVNYRSINFSFILHVAIKDLNVLYTIQKLTGGIGVVKKYDSSAYFSITSREDTDKLLELMYNYFSRLNTVKVLDFLA